MMRPPEKEIVAQYASRFALVALANIRQEYPNKPDHVLADAQDLVSPHELHPVFYGSYDWHSSVHMHWLLARLLRCTPDIRSALARMATVPSACCSHSIMPSACSISRCAN